MVDQASEDVIPVKVAPEGIRYHGLGCPLIQACTGYIAVSPRFAQAGGWTPCGCLTLFSKYGDEIMARGGNEVSAE